MSLLEGIDSGMVHGSDIECNLHITDSEKHLQYGDIGYQVIHQPMCIK